MTAGSTPSTTPTTTPLRLDIEGLRAIAVGTVLLYHLHVPWLPGGFAGVDIFFVISGFLITSLMLREVARSNTVSLTRFYARRARRLLPAASLVILFTLVVGWFVQPGSQRTYLLHDVLGSTLYVVNWVLAGRSVDYLAEDAAVSPLQHYWSLSVEEQFYIVWPLMILLALWLAARISVNRFHVAFALLGLLGLASFIWSVLLTRSDPATAYFVTTTRLWEMAAGALLAFVVPRLRQLPRAASQIMTIVGLVLIAYAVTQFSATTPWPGTAAAVPVLGTAAIIAAGVPGHDTLVGRFLSLTPMVWIGGLSYTIYLWHWPLVVLAESHFGTLSVPVLVALGVLSVLAAWATKHLVEDPIRFQRSLSEKHWRSLALGGATMAVICAVAVVGLVTRPTLDDDVSAEGPAALVADPDAQEWTLIDDPASAYTTSGELTPDPDLAPEDVPYYYDDDCQVPQGVSDLDPSCVYGDPEGDLDVVLWGDSKLGQYFTAVDSIARQEGWELRLYLKSACAPTIAGSEEDCNAFGQNALDAMLEDPPDLVLVSAGTGPRQERIDGMVDAYGQLEEAGIPVVALMDNTAPEGNAYECASENRDDLTACDFPDEGARGGELLTAVAEESGIDAIDLNRWICPTDSCPVAIGDELIFRQGSHITDTYARSLAPFLHRELVRLGHAESPVDEIGLTDVPDRDGTPATD